MKKTIYSTTSFAWIYPALWGIMMYNVLRAITDLAHNGIFWEGDIRLHIVALSLSVMICYICGLVWRHRLNRADGHNTSATEYLYVFTELLVFLNIMLVAGQAGGILHMGAGWIDYVLINVSYLPLLLIFYTLIRNGIISRKLQEQMLTLEKLKTEKNEAELNFLKSQYHPHFLFNALNTIYFQVDENNDDARRTVERLSDLLRYQLYDVAKKVRFAQEIKYLQSYIAFQRLRKSENLVVALNIDSALQEQLIQPLLFQPLVENAFKYVGGSYEIGLTLKLIGKEVRCTMKNSLSLRKASEGKRDAGIGLDNLKRRLELLYPGMHRLTMNEDDDVFIAELTLNLD